MSDKETKEINLIDLIREFFSWLGKIFKQLGNFIGFLLQIAYKYKFIYLATVLLFLAVGLYLSRAAAWKYEAGATVLVNGSDKYTVEEAVKQLQNSSPGKNSSLSQKLNLPDSVTKNIIKIENFNVIDFAHNGTSDMIDFKGTHPLSDTFNIVMPDRFYIRFTLKNKNQATNVQDAFLNYLNTNPVIKDKYDIVKSDLKNRIDICYKEVYRIDSLAKVMYFKDNDDPQIKFENNKLVVGDKNKQLFYYNLMQLQDSIAKMNNEYVNFKQPVYLPAGLILDPTPINNPKKYGVMSLLFGVLFGFFVTYLLYNFKHISKYITDKK